MDNLNNDFESPFEFDSSTSLQLKHSLDPAPALDRSIIATIAGSTGYKVTVRTVQYTTYAEQPACLVAFNVAFWWRDTLRGRYKAATIEVSLHAVDAAGNTLEDEAGPNIVQLAPALVYGDPAEETSTKTWTLGANVSAGGMGVAAGGQVGRERSTTQTRERRMRIQGRKYGPLGGDAEDTAVWTLEENPVQRDGVLENFTCALVFAWPGDMFGHGVHARCTVEPQVVFSLAPKLLSRLKPKKVSPIGFDGRVGRGVEFVAAGKDLADEDVQWGLLVGGQRKYEVQQTTAE